MSCGTTGKGYILFKKELDKDTFNAVEDALLAAISCDGELSFKYGKRAGKTYFDIWDDYTYHEDFVMEALGRVATLAEIEEGELAYTGIDSDYWRFLFKGGKWREQNGHIVYEDVSDVGDTVGEAIIALLGEKSAPYIVGLIHNMYEEHRIGEGEAAWLYQAADPDDMYNEVEEYGRWVREVDDFPPFIVKRMERRDEWEGLLAEVRDAG